MCVSDEASDRGKHRDGNGGGVEKTLQFMVKTETKHAPPPQGAAVERDRFSCCYSSTDGGLRCVSLGSHLPQRAIKETEGKEEWLEERAFRSFRDSLCL